MAIQRQTVIDSMHVLRNGVIYVRVGLLLIEDDKEISTQWHRVPIVPGDPAGDVLVRTNQALGAAGWPQIQQSGLTTVIGQIVQLVHTPAVIAAYEASQESMPPAPQQP